MRTLRDLYPSIPLDRRIPKHPVPIPSDQWLKGYPYLCTLVLPVTTGKLLANECYRDADASRPIPFDPSRWADSNETIPDTGGHLPAEVSPFFSLLTSIAMRTVQNLHDSIPLYLQITTHCVPPLSDYWLQGYPFFCTCVPRVFIFKLLATECYRHADASGPVPLDSPRRMDPNETLPDSPGPLPAEISAFHILLTTLAMRMLRNLYHSIPLDRRIPTNSVPMLSDRWL